MAVQQLSAAEFATDDCCTAVTFYFGHLGFLMFHFQEWIYKSFDCVKTFATQVDYSGQATSAIPTITISGLLAVWNFNIR